MREILFKAKRTDNGEWVEGDLVHSVYKFNDVCVGKYGSEIGMHQVEPDTLCQYTGLTDKNGNKIWENDVVRYYDDLAEMEKEDLIKWNETHASFTRLHESKMGLQYLYIDECIANRCEVIGNIFDNADLLEGE